jgi:hypothetical protein
MWETAERAGLITANLMWCVLYLNSSLALKLQELIPVLLTVNRPGPPTTLSGVSPTYFVPWRDRVPLQEKLDQILEWIDIEDVDERPELILSE